MKNLKALLVGFTISVVASSAFAVSHVHFGAATQPGKALLQSSLKSRIVPFSIINTTDYSVDVVIDERPHGDLYHFTLSPSWDSYYSQWSDDDPYWNVEATIRVNGEVFHRVVNSAQPRLYVDPGYGQGAPIVHTER